MLVGWNHTILKCTDCCYLQAGHRGLMEILALEVQVEI